MRIKINTKLSLKQIQKQYRVSRTTAWRAQKRGYICKPNPVNISNQFVPEEAYKIAKAIYWRCIYILYPKTLDLQEDIWQEIVLALYLKSGYPEYKNGGWRWKTGLNAGRDFLYRELKIRIK